MNLLLKLTTTLSLRAGEFNSVSVDGTEQDIKVVKVITHPSYHNPVLYSNDIALLKLETPATLNRSVVLGIIFCSVVTRDLRFTLQIKLRLMKFLVKGS